MTHCRALTLFGVLSAAGIWLLERDLRPPPLYRTMTASQSLAILHGVDVAIEFTPPRAPSAIVVPFGIAPAGSPLRVGVTETTEGRELAQVVLDASGVATIELVDRPPPGGRLRVWFSSAADTTGVAPRIFSSQEPPRFQSVATRGGSPLGNNWPLLLLEYPWPSQRAVWVWFAMIPLTLAACRSERWLGSFLVGFGLCATVTSVLWWQYDYTRHFGHWDADEFGLYATTLAGYLTEPASRLSARAWFHAYNHTHNPLGPLAMTAPIALGIPMKLVYPWFSSLCAMASLLVYLHILRRRLGIAYVAALVMVTVTGCHILVLRSFARPVTDALGLLLAIASVDLLLGRLECGGRWNTVVLALLNMLHTLARPQGIALVPVFTVLALLADAWRQGRPSAAAVLWRAAVLAAAPLAALAGLFLLFGWLHNLETFLAERPLFRRWNTTADFGASLLVLVQGLPFLWLPAWRRRAEPRLRLLLLWAAAYLALLIAAQAPFWTRHFLPLLPTVGVVTAVALEETRRRARGVALVVLLLLATANVALVAGELHNRTHLRLAFKRYATLG